ncbi:hypothetical protein ALC57_11850 [Trachymyrmex cornetzi]|uniref:Uncharacterized protein n=1 Tax=Trachymyrmex cornetzi TaxID=471704 RepID=A0A195DSW0_9HYME|nr:hypothetical protein ALC57_11850 [Trachymyrmex cornetzi]
MIAFQEIINRQTKRSAPHEWQHTNLCAKRHAGRRKKINAEVVGIQSFTNNEIITVFKKGFKIPFSEPQFFRLRLKNKASLFILKTVKVQETKKQITLRLLNVLNCSTGEEREDKGPAPFEGGAVKGTIGRPSDGGDDDEEVGSSHVDRNGPTKFYPTIREARRGSGPRPTAATARSARAASLELRLASELRVREAEKQRCPERRRSVVCGIRNKRRLHAHRGILSFPEGATQRKRGRRDVVPVLTGRLAECALSKREQSCRECVAVVSTFRSNRVNLVHRVDRYSGRAGGCFAKESVATPVGTCG